MQIKTKNNVTLVAIHDPSNLYQTFKITEHEDGSIHCISTDSTYEFNKAYDDINDCFADLVKFEENLTELAIEKFFEEYNSH